MLISNKIPAVVGVLIGFLLYELGNTVQYLVYPIILPTLFRVIGVALLLFNFFKTPFARLEGSVSFLWGFFVVWSIIIVLRGSFMGNFVPGTDQSRIGVIRRIFLFQYGELSFLIPLVAFLKPKCNFLYYYGKIGILACFVALIMTLRARDAILFGQVTSGMTNILNEAGDFITVRELISATIPGLGLLIFCLFNYSYIKNRFSILLPITIFVFFICTAIGGGRGMTTYSLIYLLLFFIIVYKYPIEVSNKTSSIFVKRLFAVLISVFFIMLLVYLYNNTTVFDYVLERAFGDKQLGGDFNNNARESLIKDLIADFNKHPLDWVWGRGANGTYETQVLSVLGRRSWMEVSYYYLILKGGIVYLFLFIGCHLHGLFMGLFRSKNVFSKVLGIICGIMIINLASASSQPNISVYFFISWFCFGLVERRDIRMMSDYDIYGYFNCKNYQSK